MNVVIALRVPHEELEAAIRRRIEQGVGAPQRPATVPARYVALERLFASVDADAAREGRADATGSDDLTRALRQVASKAPVALRLAGRLIEEGAGLPLREGLAAELAHLVEIFSTRDAYEGLSTLGKRAPVYEGR